MKDIMEVSTLQLAVENIFDQYFICPDNRVKLLESLDKAAVSLSTDLHDPFIWRTFLSYLSMFGPKRFFDWVKLYSKNNKEFIDPFASLKNSIEVIFYSRSAVTNLHVEKIILDNNFV